jgi:hypothetical protein
LPVVLYGCKTWSLRYGEEHRLRAFERGRVLRRILRLRRDETIRGCRNLHNKKLHNVYSSANIIRMISSPRMNWQGM